MRWHLRLRAPSPVWLSKLLLRAAVPAVNKVKASAVEKAFMNQMAGVVQASLNAGALDMKAVTEILNAAVKAGVSDQVMGSLVSMAEALSRQRARCCFRRR